MAAKTSTEKARLTLLILKETHYIILVTTNDQRCRVNKKTFVDNLASVIDMMSGIDSASAIDTDAIGVECVDGTRYFVEVQDD